MTGKKNTLWIVVADDHELVRRGIRDLLQEQPGWRAVGEAAKGRDAVQMVKTMKPDVAILDITMPDRDGLEATRQIHEVTNESLDPNDARVRPDGPPWYPRQERSDMF